MYSTGPALVKLAADLARAALNRIDAIRNELADAERRKAKAEDKLERAQSAGGRIDSFEPQSSGGIYQCPHCWIDEGIHSDLNPIPSDTNFDWFRCKTCGRKVELGA
jgi:hypothetical protein